MAASGLLAKIPESERKKVLVLGALVVVLVGSLAYAYSGTSKTPPPPAPKAGVPQDPNRIKNSDLRAGREPGGPVGPAGVASGPVTALEIGEIAPASSGLAITRNPFAYPPPPPPPKPKPAPIPPPPTIPIGGVTPGSVVAGVPRGVTITVSGNQIPPDAQILWNNRPVRTEFVNATQVRATLSAAEIASAGTVTVKVVSASQPDKLWSRELPFTVSPAPTPPFKYIGRIGDEAVLDFGTPADGRKRARVGDVVGVPAQWKILTVGKDQIEVLDTRNEIRRTVPLAKKS